MSSFDYLRSAQPLWVRRLLDYRIPERLHAPCLGLSCAFVVAAGACGIGHYRVVDAQRVEAQYRRQFESSRSEAKRAALYYRRVKALLALDADVRAIAASGDKDARRLADIANHLPSHAWLTAIVNDAGGITLEGEARDLGIVGAILRELARAREVRDPALAGASIASDGAHERKVKYSVHLQDARR